MCYLLHYVTQLYLFILDTADCITPGGTKGWYQINVDIINNHIHLMLQMEHLYNREIM